MTDQAVDTPAATTPLADPDDRGRTTIGDGVVEQIARIAANDVDGVAAHGSDLGRLVGRQYPKASAEVAGSRARLHVEVAVTWPAPIADVCARVRDSVAARVRELTGLEVDTVDVTAAQVVQPEQPTVRRVQ